MISPEWLCFIRKFSKSGLLLCEHSFKPNSVVQAWIGCLTAQFSNGAVSIKDVTNSTRSISAYQSSMYLNAAANISTHGVVVGSGNVAVAITDYKLQTQIIHGTGANQLQYSSAMFPEFYSISGGTAKTDIRRLFTNASGSDVAINEIGLYCDTYFSYKFCIERTLFSQTLADGESLEVTYRLSKTI